MSKFKKIAGAILMVEIIIIVVCNILCIYQLNNKDGRLYRVEAKRVERAIKDQLAAAEQKNTDENTDDSKGDSAVFEDKFLMNIDLSNYQTILDVHVYNPNEIIANDYLVCEVEGKLYCIEYSEEANGIFMIYMNVAFAIIFIVTFIIFVYIQTKLLKPFANMQHLSVELAKGNLAVPIKEEKSKFFGRFLWGMDMLRENLEDKKKKELELQKEKKTLILSLSHDIKTPLSAIELYTKALEDDLYDTKEKKEEALLGIKKNAEEIKSYVNEITKASREDFLNLEVNNGELYLKELVELIKAHYVERLSVLHTDFTVEDVADCLICGDKDRLVEVIQNIIENAIKYGDGKKISISFDDEEDCKLITVSNTGLVPQESEETYLFDSFYRGSNCGNASGSGLGLYICKHLMKLMDGDIFIKISGSDTHSEADEQNSIGTFSVTLVIRKA